MSKATSNLSTLQKITSDFIGAMFPTDEAWDKAKQEHEIRIKEAKAAKKAWSKRLTQEGFKGFSED